MSAVVVRTLEIGGQTYNLIYAGNKQPRQAVPVAHRLDQHTYTGQCNCKPLFQGNLLVHQ